MICTHRYVNDATTQGRSLAALGTTWGVTNKGEIYFTAKGINGLELVETKKLIAMHQNEFISKESEPQPNHENTKPQQRMPAVSIQTETDDTLAKAIRDSVMQAKDKYIKYHDTGKPDRGFGKGWFSFFRHGEQGKANARQFADNINKASSLRAIRKFIYESSILRYHNHSFGSYLSDEFNHQDKIIPILNRIGA